MKATSLTGVSDCLVSLAKYKERRWSKFEKCLDSRKNYYRYCLDEAILNTESNSCKRHETRQVRFLDLAAYVGGTISKK